MSKNPLLLEQCECIIEEGLKNLSKVERALEIIEQMHLYESNYDDLKSYCQHKWEIQNKLLHLCGPQDKH
jgi:hypothetical protein